MSEAELCAANVIQAWLIQQRLLWRPTMRLSGAQTAETPREGRRDGGRREEEEGEGDTRKEKSTSQEPSDLDFTFNVVVCRAKTPRQEMEQLPARSQEDCCGCQLVENHWNYRVLLTINTPLKLSVIFVSVAH